MITKSVVSLAIVCSMFAHLQAMEQKRDLVKVQVNDRIYILTKNQVQESETLSSLYKKQEDQGTIVLSEKINPEAFDYILKDLNNKEYNSNKLDDGMINQMFLAAVYLKIPQLIEKYTDITTDRITDVTLTVGDKEYVMSLAQAKKSKTLKNILEDVEDYATPIPLPNLSEEVFDYVYKDLTSVPYDSDALSVAMIVDLINAANYLDVELLLKKYQNLLMEHLKGIDTAEKFQKYLDLMQGLPGEMQIPLSHALCTEALSLFKTLPELIIKEIPDREYGYEKIFMSPDNSKMIIINDQLIQLIDLVTNKILWEKSKKVEKVLFSSDSSKVILYNGLDLWVYDITGKELLKKFFHKGIIWGFFSDSHKIIIESSNIDYKELYLVDALSGNTLYKVSLPKNLIESCYYDSDSQLIVLKLIKSEMGSRESQRSIVIIDSNTGQIIKTFKDTESNHYDVSPDGKKIIFLSKELVSVQNSFNEEGNFSWVFKKPLPTIPYVVSFSKDNKLITLVSFTGLTISDISIFVLNMLTGETIWAQSNLKYGMQKFSPNGHWLIIYGNYNLRSINLDEKKIVWTINFKSKHMKDVSYISEDIIASIADQAKSNTFHIIFYDMKTGEVITRIEKKMEHKIVSAPAFYKLKNNLFVSIHKKLLCFDISPLSIFSFLRQPYIPIEHVLMMQYIVRALKNNRLILTDQLQQFGYDDLPQEIKSMVEMHNKQFMEEQIKKTVESLKKIRRRKVKRSQAK